MANVTESLFGITPEALQAQRDQQLQEQAYKFAQLSPMQAAQAGFYTAGNRLGGAAGGLLGAEDPELQRVRQRQQLLKGADIQTAQGLKELSQKLYSTGDYQGAQEALAKAQSLEAAAIKQQLDMSTIKKNLSEQTTPEQKNAGGLADAAGFSRGTPEWQQAYNENLKTLTTKIENKSEFERVLASLNLSPEQEKNIKQQWVQAKLNPDPSGLKGLQATLVGLQATALADKIQGDKEKKDTEKKNSIQKLSDTESSLDTALATAARALKLAPENFIGASGQALLSAVPWTDQKALGNLVSTLQSEKVMGTLEQLKAQSRTGATGFGSLTEKELALLMSRITSLDPTDKMFKQNLGVVMEDWRKVQQKVRNARRELQGSPTPANTEDLINRTIEFNKSKGSMSRSQAVEFLKSQGKLPADY
jgi:hypothetical protein